MLSENQMVNVRKACETMYDHTCNIYCSQEVVQSNGVSKFEDVLLYENQPCHISQSAISAKSNGISSIITTVINLYISPDITIPAGSRIICNGNEYKNSGVPASYGPFQKIQLDYVGDRA